MPSNKVKFQPGDIVFFIGDTTKRSLDNNTPYEVIECLPNKYYNIRIKTEDNLIISDSSDNFISVHDYKNIKQPVKRKFNAGDIAYYTGPEGQGFKHNQAYVLFLTIGGDYLLKVGNNSKHISKEVADIFFISEEEYQNKNSGITSPEDSGITPSEPSKIIPIGSANYKKYTKFYEGDIVYYIGIESDMLNNDQPYKVQAYNSDSMLIRINGVIINERDVISKKEYEKYSIVDDDETVEIIGKPRSEIEIKHQIWKDTKNGKLEWFRPFSSYDKWFRAIYKLDEPKESYLRIDIKFSKTDGNVWSLWVYFHRNKAGTKISENFELVKNYNESSILRFIVNHIQNNLKEEEK